jgi:hypothetical protein
MCAPSGATTQEGSRRDVRVGGCWAGELALNLQFLGPGRRRGCGASAYHPRVMKRTIARCGARVLDNVLEIVSPLDYRGFISLKMIDRMIRVL